MRNRDEVHDALLSLVAVPTEDLTGVSAWADQLIQEGRAFVMLPGDAAAVDFLVAAERRGLAKEIYPKSRFSPAGFDSNVCDIQWEKDRDVRGEDAVAELIQAWMQASGPWTATRLAQKLALGPSGIERALLQLEAKGQVLRGSFRPSARELEWCDRRLLARIHRLTLRRLRREIEPVSPAQFMRFLFRWQHVAPGTRLHGVDGTSVVLDQLQGFETPAAAWEDLLLGARVADYRPEFLDQLCLSGQFAWGRISAVIGPALTNQDDRKPVRPTRLAPVAFFRRDNIHLFLEDERSSDSLNQSIQLTHPAREVLNHLHLQGASFFQDFVKSLQRLPVEVESGLWELVAAGLVSADGFANLRALIDPLLRRAGKKNQRRTQRRLQNLSTGRWTLVRQSQVQGETAAVVRDLEALAFQFLRRWGVFFRDLLGRESVPVAWRDLLPVLRRLEAQGRIRGGRFIAGFGGEQFALPEAVDALRTVRRNPLDGQSVHVSASDPLNLLGIIFPGPRVRPNPETQLHFRDGCPMEDRRVVG
jgi:ATP-dependent Lhr-like helicase